MSTEIDAGIWSHYNASVVLKAVLVNGLWDTSAPQDTPYPFGVFQMISDVADYNFSDDFEDVLIQFKLFSDVSGSSIELIGMFNALIKVFDFAVMTVSGHKTVSMVRQTAEKLKIEDVWQYTILYRLLLEKDVSVR